MITCTNRQQFFHQIIANFRRQIYAKKELIIVLNKDSMNLAGYCRAVRGFKNISIYKVPERISLGRCLNYAVSKAKHSRIARFDDDDYYSAYYLKEQMQAIQRSGASVVGKVSHLLYLEGKKLLILNHPGRDHRFVRIAPGGTILFRRRVFKHVRFPNISRGEDTAFLRRCRIKGFKIYSSSYYNFIGIRRKNKNTHTWTASDDALIKGSRIVAKMNQFREVAVRPC